MKKKAQNEIRIYGENAVAAIFKNRPQDIIQLFFTKQKTKETPNLIRDITTYLAKNKKSYHMVSRDELSNLTKATHHEDVAILVREKLELSFDDFLKNKKEKCLLLALDEVSNPHNIGAILRTAAHFGVDGVLLNSKKVANTSSAIRVSEGGSEFVEVFETESLTETLKLLKKNKFQIVTTSSHSNTSLTDLKWNKLSVIVFGEEANGLSKEILKEGSCIKIPGTDHVESLNVSVAASILMYDYFSKVK